VILGESLQAANTSAAVRPAWCVAKAPTDQYVAGASSIGASCMKKITRTHHSSRITLSQHQPIGEHLRLCKELDSTLILLTQTHLDSWIRTLKVAK
jgi:hypothetical protein